MHPLLHLYIIHLMHISLVYLDGTLSPYGKKNFFLSDHTVDSLKIILPVGICMSVHFHYEYLSDDTESVCQNPKWLIPPPPVFKTLSASATARITYFLSTQNMQNAIITMSKYSEGNFSLSAVP